MAIRISGPGVGLPVPRGTLPQRHPHFAGTFAPWEPPTNRFVLQGGQVFMIPAGTWLVETGGTTIQLQYRDPVSEQWQRFAEPVVPVLATTPGWWAAQFFSDGFSYRVINTAGVGITAGVTAPGSGYVQATTTVTPSDGNSVWHAIVGGALGNLSIVAGGSGYSIPPLVVIPAPPPPGLPAMAYATLGANGSVASLTLTSPGAGYKSVPPVYLSISPNEPNHDEFVPPGPITVDLVGAGTITAVLLEEFGAPLPAPPTLTITGSGSGATAAINNPVPWVAPATSVVVLQPAAG